MQGSQDLTFPSSWHRSELQISDGTARLLGKLLPLRQSSHDQASCWQWSLTGVNSWTMPWQCLGELQPEPKLCRDCEQFNNQDSSRTVLRPVFWCSGLLWFAGGRWQFWATFPTCHLLSWGDVILDVHEFTLNICSSCLPVPITHGET